MPSSVQQLGAMLGKNIKEQSRIKENLSPDEFDSQLGLYNTEQVAVELVVSSESKCYDTNALVWNHPVYGDLNVQEWNGDYIPCPDGGGAGDGRVSVQGF